MKIAALIVLAPALTAAQSAPPRKDIPTIAKTANGAVVSIIMSDKNGQPIAQGSGFVVSKDGRIVTNYHVIKSGSSAIVKLPDGAFFVVDGLLAFDKERDIAIIKAHGENFRTVTLGDSGRVQVGEQVVAIGNPLTLESTVSNGIVSAIRTIEKEGGEFLQITAPISAGSSGGPLFNMAGEVIGITTSGVRGGENLNFAIPINDMKGLLVAGPKVQDFPNEKAPVKVQAAHRSPESPVSTKLSETLQWISGAADVESGDGEHAFRFSTDRKGSCSVTVAETTRGGNLWFRVSFSLADIDPDIQIYEVGDAQSAVRFHTTNYDKKIIDTSSSEPIVASESFVFTNEQFAPKFARAFKHAVELCGGKRSPF